MEAHHEYGHSRINTTKANTLPAFIIGKHISDFLDTSTQCSGLALYTAGSVRTSNTSNLDHVMQKIKMRVLLQGFNLSLSTWMDSLISALYTVYVYQLKIIRPWNEWVRKKEIKEK